MDPQGSLFSLQSRTYVNSNNNARSSQQNPGNNNNNKPVVSAQNHHQQQRKQPAAPPLLHPTLFVDPNTISTQPSPAPQSNEYQVLTGQGFKAELQSTLGDLIEDSFIFKKSPEIFAILAYCFYDTIHDYVNKVVKSRQAIASNEDVIGNATKALYDLFAKNEHEILNNEQTNTIMSFVPATLRTYSPSPQIRLWKIGEHLSTIVEQVQEAYTSTIGFFSQFDIIRMNEEAMDLQQPQSQEQTGRPKPAAPISIRDNSSIPEGKRIRQRDVYSFRFMHGAADVLNKLIAKNLPIAIEILKIVYLFDISILSMANPSADPRLHRLLCDHKIIRPGVNERVNLEPDFISSYVFCNEVFNGDSGLAATAESGQQQQQQQQKTTFPLLLVWPLIEDFLNESGLLYKSSNDPSIRINKATGEGYNPHSPNRPVFRPGSVDLITLPLLGKSVRDYPPPHPKPVIQEADLRKIAWHMFRKPAASLAKIARSGNHRAILTGRTWPPEFFCVGAGDIYSSQSLFNLRGGQFTSLMGRRLANDYIRLAGRIPPSPHSLLTLHYNIQWLIHCTVDGPLKEALSSQSQIDSTVTYIEQVFNGPKYSLGFLEDGILCTGEFSESISNHSDSGIPRVNTEASGVSNIMLNDEDIDLLLSNTGATIYPPSTSLDMQYGTGINDSHLPLLPPGTVSPLSMSQAQGAIPTLQIPPSIHLPADPISHHINSDIDNSQNHYGFSMSAHPELFQQHQQLEPAPQRMETTHFQFSVPAPDSRPNHHHHHHQQQQQPPPPLTNLPDLLPQEAIIRPGIPSWDISGVILPPQPPPPHSVLSASILARLITEQKENSQLPEFKGAGGDQEPKTTTPPEDVTTTTTTTMAKEDSKFGAIVIDFDAEGICSYTKRELAELEEDTSESEAGVLETIELYISKVNALKVSKGKPPVVLVELVNREKGKSESAPVPNPQPEEVAVPQKIPTTDDLPPAEVAEEEGEGEDADNNDEEAASPGSGTHSPATSSKKRKREEFEGVTEDASADTEMEDVSNSNNNNENTRDTTTSSSSNEVKKDEEEAATEPPKPKRRRGTAEVLPTLASTRSVRIRRNRGDPRPSDTNNNSNSQEAPSGSGIR